MIEDSISWSEKIPLLRPLLPTADRLLPYLRRIDAARSYTNFGPLVKELERRLAELFRVEAQNVALVANGTTALSAALLSFGAKRGSRCLLPSWTFVASAAAVCAAYMEPHFVDVAPETWMPDPIQLRDRRDLADVGAVMIVAPFGMPYDRAAWDTFTRETGIPVVIDGAACFDTAISLPMSRPGTSPLMISLHATKILGAGEGGVVISTDEAMIHRLRQVCNFGIWGSPAEQILGYNGKMSEYHAAVALAALDEWPERRAALEDRTGSYIDALAVLPSIRLLPLYGKGWVSAYCTVLLTDDAHPVEARLATLGIESRRWWQDGIHRLAAYRGFGRDDLPVTEDLARRALSLPFSHDMSSAQIARVTSGLAQALAMRRVR